MRLSVLPNSPVPAYRQLYNEILSQMISGELAEGTALPPIRTVSRELGVSVITVRTAWEALEADGLIVTRAGSGCFIGGVGLPELKALRSRAIAEPLNALAETARNLGYSSCELAEEVKNSY